MAELEDSPFVSFAEAATLTGIDKYRIGAAIRRVRLTVFRSEQDARKKFVKRADLGRLTEYRPMDARDG